jgi:putative drug exporter of the RND superfamily
VLERWTRAVLRFRFLVLACWLALLAGGIYAATQLPELASNSFAVPGTSSERTRTILERNFGERPEGTFVVVFSVPHPGDRVMQRELRRRLARAAGSVPTGHAGPLRDGAGILFGEIESTLDLQEAKGYTDDLRVALRELEPDPPAYVTGQPAIQHDLDPVFTSDLRRGEAIAVPLALLVLVGALGISLAVTIPFLFAACTISATLAVVYVLAHSIAMTSYVTNLVELIGLGLAIDYSLLIVHRFREELERTKTTEDALVRTMATAGRTVVFSGTAVAIGLALLLLMPVPFVRSMGIGGLLIPLVSIAAAVTLQPVLLSLYGPRGVRRVARTRRAEPGDVENSFWARLARAIMRRRGAVLALGTALLLAAALPVFWLELTPGSLSGIPGSSEAMRGVQALSDGIGRGAVAPAQVVVDAGRAGGAHGGRTRGAIDRLADELFHEREVAVVASGSRPPYVDRTGRYARVVVAGRHEYGAPESRRFVRRLRSELVPAAGFPPGVTVDTGGAPPQGVDFVGRVYGVFPWLVLAVSVVTAGILLRAFRSLLLPLKAVLLNLLSVAAVYGLLVVVFQWGVGADLFGVHTGEIEAWVPIFLFATLFGLSMDYEVFLVTRMRESWDCAPDNARAVAHGLERTGRVVTAAALIMVAAFAGFVAGEIAGLQQLGLGLALGVLLDATLVRMALLPSLMTVLGRFNWWLPPRVARLALVEPSPLRLEGGEGADTPSPGAAT